MIKVTYTHKVSGEKAESVYPDEIAKMQWENKNPTLLIDYNQAPPVDVTEEYQDMADDVVRDAEFLACHMVLKRIGTMNKTKGDGTVTALLGAPQMVQIALALLLAAPKTARDGIMALSTDLYSQVEKDKVLPILNAVIPPQ